MNPRLQVSINERFKAFGGEGAPHTPELSEDQGEQRLRSEGSEVGARSSVVERDKLVDGGRWLGVTCIDSAAWKDERMSAWNEGDYERAVRDSPTTKVKSSPA